MQTQPATWSTLDVGDTVRGGDGADWQITVRTEMSTGTAAFVLERPGRKPFVKTMDLAAPVQAIALAELPEQRAVSVLEEAGLQPVTLHVQHDGSPPACPVGYDEPGPLLAHLYLLHGVRFDATAPDATLRELEDMHRKAHDQKGEGYVHHHHTPDYARRNRAGVPGQGGGERGAQG